MYIHMKVFKTLNLFLIFSALLPLGYSAKELQNGTPCPSTDPEVQAIKTISTTTDMQFLLKAQRALEQRKYDLYNAERDRLPGFSTLEQKRCLKKCNCCR